MLYYIKLAKEGDKDAMMKIINAFEPSIGKYARKYTKDDIRSELGLALMIAVRRMSVDMGEGAAINYLAKSIYYRFLKLIRKKSVEEIRYIPDIHDPEYEMDIEERLALEDSLKCLTKKQRMVIMKLYIEGYRIVDLARELGISRQAVHKCKDLAIKNLREEYIK